MRLDLISAELEDCEIRDLEVPAGGLQRDVEAELIDALEGCQGLVVRPGLVTERVITESEDLEIISVLNSGYDHIDIEAATERGIVVTHSPDNPGPSVAEHTVGLMLSMLRSIPSADRRTSESEWARARETERLELQSCTVGVVGLGVIGFDVARTVRRAFGSDVLASDPYVSGERNSAIYPRIDPAQVSDEGIELTDTDTLFERSDLVTVHAPLTEETREFVGREKFEKLAGGYFINTARGEVIDEAALIGAVEDELLAGVALDVMTNEPPASDNPLLHSDLVTVTPHVAGLSNRLHERGVEKLGQRIRTVLAGDRTPYTVNPEVYDE